jgi:hypothetical protein
MRKAPRFTLVALLLLGGEVALAREVVQGEQLVLSNGILRLAFDAATGELRAVDNLVQGLSLLPADSPGSRPPAVSLVGRDVATLVAFDFEVLEQSARRQALRLAWTYTEAVVVEVRAELEASSEMAFLWPRILNGGDSGLFALSYPSFPCLNTLGESAADDVLVHPLVRGMKVRDPRSSLDIQHNPIGNSRYPQAYNGMTHQLVDYYSEGTGGFFFATFDPHGTEKSIALPLEGGELGLSWNFRSWDEAPGADMELDFPLVIGANTSGDWYRAADHYRAWALTTEWCRSHGPNVGRRAQGRAAWLFEEIGAASFGLAASVDQSALLQAYHDLVGAPMFHVLGYDWLRGEGGDVLPGREPHDLEFDFEPRNIRTIERNGDRWAAFLADLRTSFLPAEMAYAVGRATLSVVLRPTPEACPTSALWRHIHAERAAQVVAHSGADSFYCDASAPNREHTCESAEHGHPRGRARWMLDGYRELYANTQAELSRTCETYVPIGVELMLECLIDRFDYYQARNGAGFMGVLEGGFYRGLQLRGLAETVPVFAYIYHDYAPVALDGCGKLSERIGDIFYWMAARVALWGGIFELNNEFSPAELFPGQSRVGQLHYRERDFFEWVDPRDPATSPYDPRKGAFLRDIAAARTGFARDFLAYGQMLPPLAVRCESVRLDYTYYNNIDWGGQPNSLEFASESGTHDVPGVLHVAWRFEDRLGLLFVNLGAEPTRAEVDFDLTRYRDYGLEFEGEVHGLRKTQGGERELRVPQGRPLVLELPARRVVLLEF